MSIRRVVPDLGTDRMDESREFYIQVFGFELAMDMGWIVTLASPDNPTAHINLLRRTGPSDSQDTPDLTIEVTDVDAVHDIAVERGLEVVYPLTDEPATRQGPYAGDADRSTDDEQPPSWQPVDAERERRHTDDDFARALEIDGKDFLRAPVGEPETIIVPTRRLAEDQKQGDLFPKKLVGLEVGEDVANGSVNRIEGPNRRGDMNMEGNMKGGRNRP